MQVLIDNNLSLEIALYPYGGHLWKQDLSYLYQLRLRDTTIQKYLEVMTQRNQTLVVRWMPSVLQIETRSSSCRRTNDSCDRWVDNMRELGNCFEEVTEKVLPTATDDGWWLDVQWSSRDRCSTFNTLLNNWTS